MTAKKSVINFLESDRSRLRDEKAIELLPKTFVLEDMKELPEESKYAISISAYCDILEDIAYE